MVAVRRTLPAPPELQSRWAAVLEEAGLRPRILQLHDRYPEERSLEVGFPILDAVDTGLADLLLERPDQVLEAGTRAMRELLPVAGPEAEGLRLRVIELPPTGRRMIRGIRETDLNRFVAIDGIVRRVTEVRPQIRDAVFECVSCRVKFHEPQDEASLVFREPLECPESQGGCGKTQGRTRFRLVAEESTYVDAQRIEIQEHPETLKHGAHPQGLSVLLTEDLTGKVLPGNRIILNGILKSFQRASASRSGIVRNTTFDLMVLANSFESKTQEYAEIELSPDEVALIEKFRGDPTVVDKIVLSLAPTIKGMEQEKEAIALQLFGGVEKKHSDGVRVRGDIHCLIVGDPGCLIGDERVTLGDGTTMRLDRMGTAHLQPIARQVRLGTGSGHTAWATRFHRYAHQPILEVVTESGKCIKGTYNHPLLRWNSDERTEEWVRLDRLRVGDRLRVAPSIRCWKTAPVPTGWKPPRYYHKSWHVKVPEFVDEDLAAILGYVLGNGSISERRVQLFPSSDEGEVTERISALFEKVFGVTPQPQKVRWHSRPLQVNRTPIARWLSPLRNHRVPPSILGSPNRVVASFLRWLFEADGCCFANGRGRTAIQLRSAERELLRDVQTLLLRWGIHSRILWSTRPPKPHLKAGRLVRGGASGNLVIRQASSMLRFAKSIGFVSARKKELLEEVRQAAQGRSRRRHLHTTERIVSIRRAGTATVYDIEVPGPQRFIANGIISHNTAKSQLLRYIADVAPRGIYTSGKGATAAGLTAAAVKDDFAGGRWVLEAGMLVLADGGMAIIDELDKMSPEDRSAMHEALEQQSYHRSFEVMLYNGERRPIGDLVDGLIRSHPDRVMPGKDCEILALEESERFPILTTDLSSLSRTEVVRVSRHKAPDHFVRVHYANGRALTVTPEHPLFVWKGNEWSTIPASRARGGDLAPGVSEYPRQLNEAVLRPSATGLGRKELVFPSSMVGGLARLLGYIASEGHIPDKLSTRPAEIGVANTDPEIVADLRALFRELFHLDPYVQSQPASTRAKATRTLFQVRAVSVDLLHYFHENFPELARKAPEKRIPGAVFHATEACRVEFLVGAYRGDGFYDSERFGLCTSSDGLARDYADLLLTLGIYSYITRAAYSIGPGREGTNHKVVISGATSRRRFLERIAASDPRSEKIRAFVERSEHQSMDEDRVPPQVATKLKLVLSSIGLDNGSIQAGNPPTRGCHRSVMARELARVRARLGRLADEPPRTPRAIRRAYHLPAKQVASRLGRSVGWLAMHDQTASTVQGRVIHAAVRAMAGEKHAMLLAELRSLEQCVTAPIRIVPIREVETIPNNGDEFVYDVTVEPTHTFVAEGLVLHNSVSIAKAGITSTLNARCPVLAAANPKWGRFTNDRTISEQIDLPPTLLSRFDVIFSIKDLPDQVRDRRLANRILASHQIGAGPTQGTGEASAPPFSPELLKKYIAYAKRNIRPILSDASLAELEDYYVKVRRQGEEPNAPVPITARQLEALVRMSEAAARARLSNVVEVEDARRATRIMENFLRRVSMTEEGKLDIDLTQGGVSHSQRERFDIAQRVMRELQEANAGYFTVEQYHEAMEKADIAKPKADAILQTLRNQGEIIEARPNQLQLVRF